MFSVVDGLGTAHFDLLDVSLRRLPRNPCQSDGGVHERHQLVGTGKVVQGQRPVVRYLRRVRKYDQGDAVRFLEVFQPLHEYGCRVRPFSIGTGVGDIVQNHYLDPFLRRQFYALQQSFLHSIRYGIVRVEFRSLEVIRKIEACFLNCVSLLELFD